MQGDDVGDPDRRRHLVNHESGHVFGLRDNDPYVSCVYSIMHPSYYGCPGNGNPAWPSSNDFSTVTTISNTP